MKLSSAILLTTMAGASAFTAPVTRKSVSALSMADTTPESIATEGTATMEAASTEAIQEEPVQPKKNLPKMSQSIPFMERPYFLDGSMAGDVGFDPIGFADSTENLMNYREAEIKHARLAMLAAAGWPLSELWDKPLAHAFGLQPVLDAGDRVPSVLNGGLGKVSIVYWFGCIFAAMGIELIGLSKMDEPNRMPGDLGWKMFYPKDEEGQKRMQLAEIKNGRLAMIAITAFAFQELVTKQGVIDQTPLFFKPFFLN